MKLAIGYCRVSSAQQAAEGISLEAQEAKIKAWAEYNEYELLDILRDNGKSGYKMNRPNAKEVIRKACQNKATLVIYSCSRLCRDRKDLFIIAEQLKKAGANLVSLTEQIDTTTAMGNGFFGFIAVMNQIERDLASERTKAALAYVKSQGKRMGSIDYGWMPDKSRPEKKIKNGVERITYPYLMECPEEQAAIARMKQLKEAGHSTASIIQVLDLEGRKPRNGGRWALTCVKRILKRQSS